jgi:peptide/nickel transport system ATP-binding protein
MYLGRIVEMGPVDRIFEAPAHPYTRALMLAIPTPDPRQRRQHLPLQGETPSPTGLSTGCAFASRCPHAVNECHRRAPALAPIDAAAHKARWHTVACLRQSELPAFDPLAAS